MLEIEKKKFQTQKKVLMKANVEMKSAVEAKEDEIMTKWKITLLRETTKIRMHASPNGF